MTSIIHSWLTCFLSASVFYILYFTFQRLRSPLSAIPGPFYTKLTPLPLIWQEFSGNRRLYIHNLHRIYGPVVRLGPNEISFTSANALREIYSEAGGFNKTELYTLFMQFGFRTTFSTLLKREHGRKKRVVASPYTNSNILREQVMSGSRERAVAFVRKCMEQRGSVDVYIYLHCFALDCASHFLFNPSGTRSIEGGEDLRIMEELSYHNSLQVFLIQYYFSTVVNLLLKMTKARPAPLSQKYVLKVCANKDSKEGTLLHKLQSSNGSFQDEEIAAECMDHLAAGIDTVGDALCFLMYQISSPSSVHVQDKLHLELLENKDKGLDQLEYLDAVLRESLRCFPPIPMSQPRKVPQGGRHINNYFIPDGTIVSCQAYSVHRLNDDVFHNGDKFIPERWLDASQSLKMNRLFFAFGFGSRGCTGKYLAMVEMKTLIRAVYSSFRTRVADDMQASMEISDQIISSRPRDQTCRLVFERI